MRRFPTALRGARLAGAELEVRARELLSHRSRDGRVNFIFHIWRVKLGL